LGQQQNQWKRQQDPFLCCLYLLFKIVVDFFSTEGNRTENYERDSPPVISSFLRLKRNSLCVLCDLCGYRMSSYSERTSVRCPVTAAAAAIAGLMMCVSAPGPWRPSKLRFVVEAERSPRSSVSPLAPPHIEQLESRHSKPASRKIRWSPSASA